MRIVILTSGVRGIGSYCLNLYNYLTSKGHDVLFVSEATWKKQKIPTMYQAKSKMLFGLAPLVYNPSELIKAIEDFKPDIIHHHWPCGTMDVLFESIRKFDVPIVVTLHVAIGSKKFIFDKAWYAFFGLFIKHIKKVEAVNSISVFIEKQLKSRVTLPEDRLKLIYAGVNEKVFMPMDRKKDDKLRLIFVGQIMPEKGIDVLVEAVIEAKKQRDVELEIIGEGHMKKLLQDKTKNYPFIKWIGFLKEQKMISQHYSNVDATILPTRWDEAFSLVPVESLACGTPVIATNLGGTPELIFSGKTGYLLKECNKAEITEMILKLDKNKLEKMRKNCRNLVLEKYTLSNFGSKHEELYSGLIKDYKKKKKKK